MKEIVTRINNYWNGKIVLKKKKINLIFFLPWLKWGLLFCWLFLDLQIFWLEKCDILDLLIWCLKFLLYSNFFYPNCLVFKHLVFNCVWGGCVFFFQIVLLSFFILVNNLELRCRMFIWMGRLLFGTVISGMVGIWNGLCPQI